jgi:hypothetical protein
MVAQAKMDPASNPLIKALIAEFGTAEGRKAARDDLKAKLADSKPAEVKSRCIETLRQAAAVVDAKAPEGSHRRRISWHRWLAGKRSREGYAHGDLQRPKVSGMIPQ